VSGYSALSAASQVHLTTALRSQIIMTTYGPREVSELWTFRQARLAGVNPVAYQMSVRRKLRDEARREQARYIAATLEV
jgi:hypothetical protein